MCDMAYTQHIVCALPPTPQPDLDSARALAFEVEL